MLRHLAAMSAVDGTRDAGAAHAIGFTNAPLQGSAGHQLGFDQVGADAALLHGVAELDAGHAIHALRCDGATASLLRSWRCVTAFVGLTKGALAPVTILANDGSLRGASRT
jgi:hypothetical protein